MPHAEEVAGGSPALGKRWRRTFLGRGIAWKLTAIVARRGKPGMVVSYNGTGLASNAIPVRRTEAAIAWHYTALGKAMQNGYVESIHEHMHDQILNESLFPGLAR